MENNNIVNDIERIVKENMVQVIESNGRTFATKSLVEIEPRKDVAAEIRFSEPKLFDRPRELSEFGIARAPQSWCYVEEI